MPIETHQIDSTKIDSLKERTEGHFIDFKSTRIKPAKLTKTIAAFANADGGEIFIGIEDPKKLGWKWTGFGEEEDANGHIQIFESLFPLGLGFSYEFLMNEDQTGLVLRIEVEKSSDIKTASDDMIYIRRGAQNLPVNTDEAKRRLELNKGLISHEDKTLNSDITEIENSVVVIEFMIDVIPDGEPSLWLRKQRLVVDGKPTVAGVVLFSDEPQISMPKAAVKIYRYKTSEKEGTRATLESDPITIEGSIYNQIFNAVDHVKTTTESIPVLGVKGIQNIEYPTVAIHEILTNAVLHRDYSLNDDVHIRIFDDRIEVESPGRLPAHITEKNILAERFARNPKIVRLVNKFRNPPNKDVGEGLNTSFQAMRELKLREPIIQQRDNSVLVILKHEKLGSLDEIILEYLKSHNEINNSKAREICYIGDANKMKNVFKRMMRSDLIERIEGRSQSKAAYRRGANFPD